MAEAQFPILWVSTYEAAFDQFVAYPIRYSENACIAINTTKIFCLVTKEGAESINATFVSQGEWAKDFLDSKLIERWKWING